MILTIIFLQLSAIIILPVESKDEVETYWFRQVVDHFGEGKKTYWNQRYLVNEMAWKNESNSPVFFMISGKSGASNKSMTEGAWVQWARKYGALLIQLEHRYYGESHPTPNTSNTNLVPLKTWQTIKDTSNFIRFINEKYSLKGTNKWITFGCGYSGTLATWTRYHLPSQIYAAITSAARLEAKYDFHEYWDVAAKAMESEASNCTENFRTSLAIINYFKEEYLIKSLNLCNNFNPESKEDMIRIFIKLGELLEPALEYNGQSPGPNNIKYICKFLNNETEPDPFIRLTALLKDRNKECLDVSNEEFLKTFKNTSWDHPVNKKGSRPWLWQTCTDIGQYRTSESYDSLLLDGIPLDYFLDVCQTVFNVDKAYGNTSVTFTDVMNEATSIRVERVVFVEGTLDPWSPLAMIKYPTDSSPLVKIEGGSHCQDLLTPKDSDSAEVKKARKTIDSYLAKWLN